MRKILALLVLLGASSLLSAAQTTAQQAYTITITAASCQLAFTSGQPPNGTADGKTAYGPFTFTASTSPSCTLPLVWAATGLPTGLTLNSGTGVLSGTLPTSACSSGTCKASFTVTVATSGNSTTNIKQRIKLGNPSGRPAPPNVKKPQAKNDPLWGVTYDPIDGPIVSGTSPDRGDGKLLVDTGVTFEDIYHNKCATMNGTRNDTAYIAVDCSTK
jgi:hypothetical protein